MAPIEEVLNEPFECNRIEVRLISLPLKKPFTISRGEIKRKGALLVRIDEGWGEAPVLPEPIYNEEDSATAWHIAVDLAAPRLLELHEARGHLTLRDVCSLLDWIRGHRVTLSAFTSAFTVMVAERKHMPLAKLLGGVKDRVRLQHSIGLGGLEHLRREIEYAWSLGIEVIKLKVKPGRDEEQVSYARRLGAEKLTIDGNGAYSYRHLSHLAQLARRYKLWEVEQPFKPYDKVYHGKLASIAECTVSLDESVTSLEDVVEALEVFPKGRLGVNIKPPRVGGPLEALKIAKLSQEAGVHTFVGGMLETSIGRAVNIAVGSLRGVGEYLTSDISPPLEFYEEDLVEDTFTVKEGCVEVRSKPGLGFQVDHAKVEKYTVKAKEFKPRS